MPRIIVVTTACMFGLASLIVAAEPKSPWKLLPFRLAPAPPPPKQLPQPALAVAPASHQEPLPPPAMARLADPFPLPPGTPSADDLYRQTDQDAFRKSYGCVNCHQGVRDMHD